MGYVMVGGDVFKVDKSDGRRKQICIAGDMLAIAYSEDDRIVYKHGLEQGVRAWSEKQRKNGVEDTFGPICIASFPANPETVALLDRISERMGDMNAHLEGLREAAGSLLGSFGTERTL